MRRYEDRRPASNMDPYLVTMLLTCTALQLPLPVHVRPFINQLMCAFASAATDLCYMPCLRQIPWLPDKGQ